MSAAQAGTAVLESVNPANGELLNTFDVFTGERVEAKLEQAVEGFHAWRRFPWERRAELLRQVAVELRADAENLARTVSEEMGKPITEGLAEVEKCAWCFEYYAEHGEGFLRPEPVDTDDGREVAIHKRPLGVILAVMPWNYPLWQALRCAAPITGGGNAFLLKHASNVTGCALALEQVFVRSGLPDGVFSTLVIPGSRAGALVADSRIAGVTLTGSDQAGSAVGAEAGRAVKPIVLELGGSDPFIVLDDVDLDRVVEVAVNARFQNTGQSCVAAKRFIVVESRAEEFEQRFGHAASGLLRGDPLNSETQLGPMARVDLRDELAELVDASLAAGARALTGAKVPDQPGAWYEPTILVDLPADAPVLREETFGPVAAVVRVANEQEAVAAANDSIYGLGCSLWTDDLERAQALAADIEAGMVFVNAMTASDPRIPFGGVKRSGHGRELGGGIGMGEFLNLQTVAVAAGG
jgi:acyl-CoA reductase-like NAD-dependent aldehyde dehydrogenase